jgi:hypothetical protein
MAVKTVKNTAIAFVATAALTACTRGMQLEKAKMAEPGG